MGEKNTIALLTSINGYLKTMVDSSKQNNAQSPEDKEKKSVKNSEKQVKTLSTGGLGSGLKTEIKEETGKAGNLSLNSIISGIDSLKQLPVVIKMFAKIKDKDIVKFEKCFKSLANVLEDLSDDKTVKGSESVVRIASTLSILEKLKIRKILTNLLLFNVFKVDKLLKTFTTGIVTAFEKIGKVSKADIKKMEIVTDAMKSLDVLAKGTMIVVGSVIALALAIKFIGVKEIMIAGAAVLAIMGIMTLVLKSVINITSKMSDGVKKLDRLANVVLKFQFLILTTLLVGMLATKSWKQIAIGFGAVAAIILGYALVVTIGELVYGLFDKKRKTLYGIVEIAACFIAITLATVLVGEVVKRAWDSLLYGLGGVAATLLGYVLVITLGEIIYGMFDKKRRSLYGIFTISAFSIALVLATLLVGYIVKENWDSIVAGFIAVAGILFGYTYVINLAAKVNKVGKDGVKNLLGICLVAGAAETLVLAAAAIPYAMKKMNTTWPELIGTFGLITVMLGEIAGLMFALKTVGNSAAIQQGVITLGMIAGLVAACEGLLFGAILLGAKAKEDPVALTIGIGALGSTYLIIKGLKRIIKEVSPIRATLSTAYPTMLKVISLVYLCEGIVAAAILIGQLVKKEGVEGVGYGALVLGLAGGIVVGVTKLAKQLGKVKTQDLAKQAVFKQLIILAYAAIGLVGAAILVGKLIKEEDNMQNAGLVLAFAGLIVYGLIKLINIAGDNRKKIQKGEKDLKTVIILAAAAEALVLGAILIAQHKKDTGITDEEVGLVLGLAASIVTGMGALAWTAGKLDKTIKEGIKSLKQITILAAATLALVSGAVLIAKYQKDSKVSGTEVLITLGLAAGIVTAFGVLCGIAGALDKTGVLKSGAISLLLVSAVAAAAELVLGGVILLVKYRTENNISWDSVYETLAAMATVITAFGTLSLVAGAVFPFVIIGSISLLGVVGVVYLTTRLMHALVFLTSAITKLNPSDPEKGFELIDKTLEKMKSVVKVFGELCFAAGLAFRIILVGLPGIIMVSKAAFAISTALVLVSNSAKSASKLNEESIEKMTTTFKIISDKIYDIIGVDFILKAAVISSCLSKIQVISLAASTISTCMGNMAGIVNDDGKMRSMTVTKDGKVVYGEWGDPLKAATVMSSSMAKFADTLYTSFSKMNEDGLKMVSVGAQTMSKVISPVSSFAKALMAFQEAGDGKIREIKFNDKGEQIDTPIVDVAAVATSVANAVSNFCNVLFSEENQNMWARISQGSISTHSKDADGKESSYESEGSTKAAMGALGVIIDPISNFAKTLSMFEDSGSENEIVVPIYDQNGKLVNKRIINVVNVATKIGAAVNSFINQFVNGAKVWTNLYGSYKNDPTIKKQTDGIVSDEVEYGDATNTMMDSMGVFATVLSPIISFVNLLASLGDVEGNKLKVFDSKGKSRIIDPGVIATTIGNTITSFMRILADTFKDKMFATAFSVMSNNAEGLKTVFGEFTNALNTIGEIDSENVTKFYKSFNDILTAVLSFNAADNKAIAEGSIKLLTSFSNTFIKMCNDTVLNGLQTLNKSLDEFKETIGSDVVNALTNLNKVLNEAPSAFSNYSTALNETANNKKIGVVNNNNKVAVSVNKTRVALAKLDSVLEKGSRNRIRRFDEMTVAVNKLNESTSRATGNLSAIVRAIQAINSLCANASNDNVKNALDAVRSIGSSLSSNAASLNGFNLPGTTSGIGSINQGNSSSLSGHELKQILVDVFDGASWSLTKSVTSRQNETLFGSIDIFAGAGYNSDVTNRHTNEDKDKK